MQILGILDEIANNSSKNFKIDMLKENANNEVFKKVCQLAYCPVTQFYIKQIPEVTAYADNISLDEALDSLSKLSNREFTGHNGRDYLRAILCNLTEENAIVLKRVVLKDLRAGFSESSINKAMGKGTIKETPYMGAVSYGAKKVDKLFSKYDRVFSEVKMDGRYSNVKITEDSVFMESRGGKPTPLGGVFDNLIKLRERFGGDVVINGELIIPDMDRYTSNGVIASLISINGKALEGKINLKEVEKFEQKYKCNVDMMADRIVLVAWDYLPLADYDKGSWDCPRATRMKCLQVALRWDSLPNIKFVEYKEVTNVGEAMAHFKDLLNRGEEGTILKGGEGHWKDGKPTFQVKFKLEMTVDLEIIGFNYGTKGTKNEHVISSVDVQSSDGLRVTSPTGIDEKTMKMLTENQESLIGSILEVKCSGLSSNSKGEYALLHPVYIGLRDGEKITADSLSQIQENENMIKELK